MNELKGDWLIGLTHYGVQFSCLASLRAVVRPEELEKAWSNGLMMSLQEAVADALTV